MSGPVIEVCLAPGMRSGSSPAWYEFSFKVVGR